MSSTQGSAVSIASGSACDEAGNCASSVNAGPYKIDSTPPIITSSATVNGNPYTSGTWTNQNVVVHFSCNDSLSGVATVTGLQTVSAQGAGQQVTGICYDKAGNSSQATFTGIDIDTTPPVITFAGNTTYGILQTVDVTCLATDALSGIATTNCNGSPLVNAPASSFTPGPHSVSATATDKAGNVTNSSTSFTIAATPADLGTLTKQFVQGSSAYKGPRQGLGIVLLGLATGALSEVGPHNSTLHNEFAVAV